MTDYLFPHDSSYDTERTGYNLSVDHKPEVVVVATSAAAVVDAVRYATGRGLGVAVQATGHGVSVPADGQVLINTSRMDGVTIDPATRTAKVEAGVRGGALVRAAAEHGLAPVNGSSPEVGVVSYHLGGGIGVLGRQLGWAVDHVRSLDIVTADGQLRHVTATSEPELFWALRGGGKGNLGVVVALEIDLHPIARLYGGGLHFDATDPAEAERVLTTWGAWTRTTPETMGTSVLLIQMPDLPVLPEPIRGKRVIHVRVAFTGQAADGERQIAPLRELGPVTDSVTEMPYSRIGTIHAEPTAPAAFHARNAMLHSFDQDTAAEIVAEADSARFLVEVRHMGGAFARPGAMPSALGRRDGDYVIYAGGVADGEAAASLTADLDRLVTSMEPWATGGPAVNFLSGPEVSAARLGAGYRPVDLERLAAIKRAVDPADVFRTHHGRA
ncbi:FAD/FMN-containing dehydrogenase [Nocardioides albertanoniae]|uniref:FAD/FMN-containing dehydrogenase n=1 Tax=Nocardioides albertanoniae TaxID=1175486 RepID=A0A543A1J0_9ACTN|nr:FAD-binding oxidoreductase [Nocardioides albertanoniae]TQL66434.1 FAD/FMN-containing dehydrogenase [Nocardioides albertanoniae]